MNLGHGANQTLSLFMNFDHIKKRQSSVEDCIRIDDEICTIVGGIRNNYWSERMGICKQARKSEFVGKYERYCKCIHDVENVQFPD